MRDFRKYEVWKSSIDLVKEIYKMTEILPTEEKYGLCSQIRRSSVSIPSNIAEGFSRSSEKEFARFIEIALGSSFEVETQLILATEIGYLKDDKLNVIMKKLHLIEKQLNSLRTKLK